MLDFDELQAGLSGWVIRERKAALSPKNVPDPRESPQVQARRQGQQVGSVIVAPLLDPEGPRVLGTLTVLNSMDDPDFTEQDVQLVMSVANQVSVSLSQRDLLDRIHHLAYHDVLTGLPNRMLLEDRLQQALSMAQRQGTLVGVLFLDLDGFKKVNDTHGHQLGDGLLQAVTHRWQSRLRASDTLARLSGDEFVVVLTGLSSPEDAMQLAEIYQKLASEPFELQGKTVQISASIGVVVQQAGMLDARALISEADQAMYRVKSGSGNGIHLL